MQESRRRKRKNIVTEKLKKAARKKFIIAATGGGCLIPLIIIMLFLIFSGWLSAYTLSSHFNYDTLREKAGGIVENIKDAFFHMLYGDIGDPEIFTDEFLDELVFDRKSMKMMLELIEEYNTDRLEIELNIQFSGYYYDWVVVEKKRYRVKRNTTTWKSFVISDSWIREKYPIDWQVVYLLCYYDSLDNGGKSSERDENGKKIRLKKSYIKKIIEDVSDTQYDIAADYIFYKNGGHDLFVKEHNWGFLKRATQGDVRGYGASETHSFVKTVYGETGYFKGEVPISKIAGVQTLTTYERYSYGTGKQSAANLISITYDISKLEGLLETYGNGRDLKTFLFAMEQLPGGEDIVADVEYAMMKMEEQEQKEGAE